MKKNRRLAATPARRPVLRPTALAVLAALACAPHAAWSALDIAQAPPAKITPYVAPNVIISLDDSGSMGWRLDGKRDLQGYMQGGKYYDAPNANGQWPGDASRMSVLKYSVKKVFEDKELIPDGKFRLAWQYMWGSRCKYNDWEGTAGQFHTRCFKGDSQLPYNAGTNTATHGFNGMRLLDEQHRKNFLDAVANTYPSAGTPSHAMLKFATEYMSVRKNLYSPWAAEPGKKEHPYLDCRRSYHIFFTDGGWNNPRYSKAGFITERHVNLSQAPRAANLESRSLPDGTYYDTRLAHTAIFRAPNMNLSNWAFDAWARDLQPDINNNVPTSGGYDDAPATERYGNRDIPKYWNPKYNPATWQHLTTYTIGMGDISTKWPNALSAQSAVFRIQPATKQVPFDESGSYPDLMARTMFWPPLMDSFDSANAPYRANGYAYFDSNTNGGLDLWSSAINGRGRFYAVIKGEELEQAFRDIFSRIAGEPQPTPPTLFFSGGSAVRNAVGLFSTSYEPKQAWAGKVEARRFSANGGEEKVPGWEDKTTADRLDALSESDRKDNRLVLTTHSATGKGVPFKTHTISDDQKVLLGATPGQSGPAAKVINYVRGSTVEQLDSPTSSPTSSKYMRWRASIQGDTVNSLPWYTGAAVSNYAFKGYGKFIQDTRYRQPILYVGANDGMLHGFSATTGKELIAYVPKGVFKNLRELTKPSFDENHLYFVDGSPMTGDVDLNSTLHATDPHASADWRTMLVGTLGGGGKGYFVLDVTNPGTLPAPANGTGGQATAAPQGGNFTAGAAANLVVMDKTMHANDATPDAESKDVGHIFAPPVLDDNNAMRTTQIALLNNDRWAVVMGNGYNSTNQRPVLLIQYLDGNKELKRIVATATAGADPDAGYTPGQTEDTTDNGLSAPRVLDVNGDGRADVAYAGDLKGNLWKFDLTAQNAADWKVAFNGQPLYTATQGGTGGGKRQPITVAPTVKANDQNAGGLMVAFGTGSNFTVSDPGNTDQQTVYSIQDNTRYQTSKVGGRVVLSVHPGSAPSLCAPVRQAGCVPVPTPVTGGRSQLQQQSVGQKVTGEGSSAGRTFWQASDNRVDWDTKRGWYLDLAVAGERVLRPFGFYDGSNILTVYSEVPNSNSAGATTVQESCSATFTTGGQYLTLLNIMDGRRPRTQIMDANGDGYFNQGDQAVTRMTLSQGHQSIVRGAGNTNIHIGSNQRDKLNVLPELALRTSWRQMR